MNVHFVAPHLFIMYAFCLYFDYDHILCYILKYPIGLAYTYYVQNYYQHEMKCLQKIMLDELKVSAGLFQPVHDIQGHTDQKWSHSVITLIITLRHDWTIKCLMRDLILLKFVRNQKYNRPNFDDSGFLLNSFINKRFAN